MIIAENHKYHHHFRGRERRGKWNTTGTPTCAVVHHSLTFSTRRCVEVLDGRNLSTNYIIDPDGTIIETCPPERMTAQCGAWNRASIGIDLASPLTPTYHTEFAQRVWGPLKFDPRFGSRKRAKGLKLGIKRAHIPDTPAQIISLYELLEYLCDRYGLGFFWPEPGDKRIAATLDPTAESQPYGIYAHAHLTPKTRWDGWAALAAMDDLRAAHGGLRP